jgi:ER membrane protein complex subunit 4
MAPPPPPPQWVIDLNSPPAAKPKSAGIPDPPGYISTSTGGKVYTIPSAPYPLLTNLQKQHTSTKTAVRASPTTEEMDILKLKKAWEVALAPVKQLPMTAIMMYMSGNSLQIFSIMMVGMAFKNPLVGLMATNQAFEKFESPGTKGNLLMVKAVYVAMQILALALGIWKVNGMGLLP